MREGARATRTHTRAQVWGRKTEQQEKSAKRHSYNYTSPAPPPPHEACAKERDAAFVVPLSHITTHITTHITMHVTTHITTHHKHSTTAELLSLARAHQPA